MIPEVSSENEQEDSVTPVAAQNGSGIFWGQGNNASVQDGESYAEENMTNAKFSGGLFWGKGGSENGEGGGAGHGGQTLSFFVIHHCVPEVGQGDLLFGLLEERG